MTILDPSRDVTGAALYRAHRLHDAPAYVKAASDEQLGGHAGLPPQAYADPPARAFPMHTAAATWFSSAVLLDRRAELPAAKFAAVDSSLRRAAEYWGIAGDLGRVAVKAAALEHDDLAALPDADFALVEIVGGGRGPRQCPLRNPEEVKAASAWAVRYRDAFDADDRRVVASKVLAKAAALGVDLGGAGDQLDRMAGLGRCAVKAASALLRDRASRAGGDADLARDLAGAADDVEAGRIDVRDRTTLCKLASLVDDLDRNSGFVRLYDSGVDRPDDVLFAVTEKVAAGYVDGHVRAGDGAVYARDDLARLPLAAVRAVGGDSLAEWCSDDGLTFSLEKTAGALGMMAPDELELFSRACGEAGIRAVTHEAGEAQRVDLVGLGRAFCR